MSTAVLVPGFNGRATQPLLVRLAKGLEAEGVKALRVELPRGRPSPGLALEVEALRARSAAVKGPLVLIGRSFGGRVAARLVASRACAGLVLLGFPIRPPGKPRPDDEAALAAVRCPLLVVQGGKDPLGPLKVLRAALPPHAQLEVLAGAGHGFGSHERAALQRVCAWAAALHETPRAPAAPDTPNAPAPLGAPSKKPRRARSDSSATFDAGGAPAPLGAPSKRPRRAKSTALGGAAMAPRRTAKAARPPRR